MDYIIKEINSLYYRDNFTAVVQATTLYDKFEYYTFTIISKAYMLFLPNLYHNFANAVLCAKCC